MYLLGKNFEFVSLWSLADVAMFSKESGSLHSLAFFRMVHC